MFSLFALLSATIASMIIGCFWYSPNIFGKAWAETQNLDLKNFKVTPLHFLAEFALSLLIALVLMLFIEWSDSKTSIDGALIGFWAAIGFVITNILAANVWGNLPFSTALIMSGYNIVRYIVMGALIGMLA